MKVRALYVNPVTAPTVELSARQYDDHAEVNGKTYTMDNILFQMNYKLPDGYTFVDGGIKMGDNNGISYYTIQEVKVSYDNECKGIIAGLGVALGAASFFTSGGWDAITSFNEVASHMNDKATTTNYVETEENVLNKMDATELAKRMYEGTPINVEKYSPIYWVANAKTKSMSGSMATLPPLRFAQKNNGNHYIYGIGWMSYKDRDGFPRTIYTDALAELTKSAGEEVSKTLIFPEKAAFGIAYDVAYNLRVNGCLVEGYVGNGGYKEAEKYAKKTNAECMLRVFSDGKLQIKDFKRGDITETTVDDFLGYYDEHEEEEDCCCGDDCHHHHHEH